MSEYHRPYTASYLVLQKWESSSYGKEKYCICRQNV